MNRDFRDSSFRNGWPVFRSILLVMLLFLPCLRACATDASSRKLRNPRPTGDALDTISSTGQFILMGVKEANSDSLKQVKISIKSRLLFEIDTVERTLHIFGRPHVPMDKVRILLLYTVSLKGVGRNGIIQRIIAVDSIPHLWPLAEPLMIGGTGTIHLVNNLAITELNQEGGVMLEYGHETIMLEGGDNWEARAESLIDSTYFSTDIEFINYGSWSIGQIRYSD